MYRKSNQPDLSPEKFELPFAEKLSPDNRWVIMAELIPWSELARSRFGGNLRRVARQFEETYAEKFSEKMDAPAKPFRMALGALIIKEKLGTSDREIVEQIKENPYLQYFIGMSDYSNSEPFEASMMVYFRERIGRDLVKKINQKMVADFRDKNEESEKKTKNLQEKK